jgi:Second BRCT domain on Nijmegen syndrome breakage protein
VTDGFADALYSSLSSMGDILAKLPDPMQYLPATEDYPADAFLPKEKRVEFFKGMKFVFLDEGQYNNLVKPINAGHGKAILFDPEKQKSEELGKLAGGKDQVFIIRRNFEGDDTFVLENAKK